MTAATDKLKANIIATAQAKTQAPATPATKVAPTITPAPVTLEEPPEVEVERVFQTYKSGMLTQKIIMPNGKALRIIDGKFITDNEMEIAFLDNEIAQGFPYLSKGEAVTSSDLDPMNALRKKFYAEFLAEQAKVPSPELGDTTKQTLTPANTAALAALSAGSNSVASE